MSSRPGPAEGCLSPELLELQEASCGLLPSSLDTVCISSPYAYGHSDCPSTDCPQEALMFYSPGVDPWPEAKDHREPASNLLLDQMLCGVPVVDEGPASSSSSVCALPGDVMLKSDVHLCAVCHDYASGYHYGVWSCEGCKAFFKRSIQGHTDYACPRLNQYHRQEPQSCQACRLRRCYQVGMVKSGVRRERCGYRGARLRRLPQVCETRGGHSARRLETTFPLPTLTHTLTLTPHQLVSCILEAEPPQIHLSERPQTPYTEASMMMSLTTLAHKELLLMISWAKKIPGFVELTLCDQVRLLECCWLEVLMLGLMWRSVDHPGKLIFCPDLQLDRDEGHCVEGMVEIFDMLLAATARFRELNLQKEEYICLKAMILLNSNLCMSSLGSAVELEGRGKVLRLLDSVTDALVWAISRTGLSFRQQSGRLAQLLMLLSHIRHLSNKGMDHLWSMKKKNVVLLYDLLLEMLDANTHTHTHTHTPHTSRPRTPQPSQWPQQEDRNPSCLGSRGARCVMGNQTADPIDLRPPES
ncbi:hypothetical protein AALO_G00000660 [Alosa alosa]|uniref:Estrogen receptor beta n=1 Tax=Alosa alosa TaxID=278164 RepID=A0AAV6HD28_9TELE|nr:hypothetical protein AALO_G00000660 [Alosa alosa]